MFGLVFDAGVDLMECDHPRPLWLCRKLFRAGTVFVALLFVGETAADDDAPIFNRSDLDFFEQRIRPVLVKHCDSCHSASASEIRGGLRLDSRLGLLSGGDSGPAVVPGKPGDGHLLAALRYESNEMPPSGPLPDDVVEDFEEWIARGVPDPRVVVDDIQSTPKYTPVQASELWSFQPVLVGDVPRGNSIRDENGRPWATSDVDRFIVDRLAQAELNPVRDADWQTLVRRLYFDLIGLPPPPERVAYWLDRFNATEQGSRETYLDLVDELLASDQYGERWGRHWLDTARYAESNGNNRNRVLRYAWRYRNWVIDALNDDQPYDDFLREQVAGDLMESSSPTERAKRRIATGFLAIGPKPYYPTIVPLDPEEPDRARFDWAAEQINAVSSGMLGLTVGCSKCHDHKFDPIPTRDYYALAGIFRSTNPRFGMYWDLFGVDEGQAQRDFLYDWNCLVLNDEILDEIRPLQALYRPLVIEENQINLHKRHWPEQIERMEQKLKADKSLNKEAVENLKRQIALRSKQLSDEAERLIEVLKLKRELKAAFSFDVDHAIGVEDSSEPRDVHLRIAGEHADRGSLIERGFLSAIRFDGEPTRINREQSGRLELAEWIVHANNPLTSRVAVNRVWSHLFGRGLVGTLDNFGSAGEPPTHPELLDFLADKFVNEFHWSQKKLIRYLVSSRAYRLDSSEVDGTAAHFDADPGNTLYWRMSPRRLEAEAIRDAMLSVCGRLDMSRPVGSPVSEFDYYADIRHEDRAKALAMLSDNRRTIYVATLRGHRHELYDLFDYPDDEVVNSKRVASNVPTQALYLLNNPLVMDYAASLAERVKRDFSDETDEGQVKRIERLYVVCFGRAPSADEVQRDIDFLRRQEVDSGSKQAWSRLAHSFLISGEFLYRM